MVIDRNDTEKYIDIWLRKEETTPDVFLCCQQYPGYTITVWHSGSQSLGEITAELLRHNK